MPSSTKVATPNSNVVPFSGTPRHPPAPGSDTGERSSKQRKKERKKERKEKKRQQREDNAKLAPTPPEKSDSKESEDESPISTDAIDESIWDLNIQELIDGYTWCTMTMYVPFWYICPIYKTLLGPQEDYQYICSSTPVSFPSTLAAVYGVKARPRHYELGTLLPSMVGDSLAESFSITHTGLICWAPNPPPEHIPFARVRFVALEALFAQRRDYTRRTNACQGKPRG